jgi:hypothetical protein
MLPDNFDFAMLPPGSSEHTLKELGMLASTLETIDYAMVSWLKEDLKLSSNTNEGFTEVPVLWQVPERALIAKRIVKDKTRNFAVVGTTRGSQKSGGTRQRYAPRANKKVVIQSLSVPIPVYVNVEYKILIKSEYQQQMNELVQPFMTRTGQINAFTLKRNGHLYEAFIDQGFSHDNNVRNLGQESRMFSTEVTINVLGYLIGEGANDDRPIVRIDENTVEVSFPQERVAPPGVPNIFGDIDT